MPKLSQPQAHLMVNGGLTTPNADGFRAHLTAEHYWLHCQTLEGSEPMSLKGEKYRKNVIRAAVRGALERELSACCMDSQDDRDKATEVLTDRLSATFELLLTLYANKGLIG